LLAAIIDSGAKFAENVAAPLNAIGDEHGCKFDNGKVTTPPGFKEAFQQYGEAGWQALGIPSGIGWARTAHLSRHVRKRDDRRRQLGIEYVCRPRQCACHLPDARRQRKMQATYLPKLISGEWGGTMCLTEAHCGSDVGLLRTKAIKNADGSYTITGNKIFISGGEQDITPNIIHAVLARIEGAPKGTKGISLFIVPKVLVHADGSLGERNAVHCGSIEKKMGNKGNATCVMNFDGAKGFLLGEENRGLEIMFNIMNTARIGTAMQGMTLAQLSFQGALAYARDRLQMRSLTGVKNPDGEADPIIVHPDVRRMLMTQKALVEGHRAFIYWLAQLVDLTKHGSESDAKEAEDLLGLLTPIAKAFCTETAVEVTNIGIQVFGGHGYIHEHGMEQVARDVRISTIWEGTTGIQALD
jgi:alkylation response protein AidB-like acyl-CoA dehydrogenase